MVSVTLTPEQCWVAAQAGLMRHMSNLRRGDSYSFNGDGWGVDIEGAGAEYAFALALKLPWTPVVVGGNAFMQLPGDVENVQIRSTQRLDGNLILHDRDPDDKRFVLIVGQMPHYVIHGWCYGHEGKHQRYWRSGGMRHPCYLVPRGDLREANEWSLHCAFIFSSNGRTT